MSTKKQHTYQSDTLVLEELKMVLGEIPEPDPQDKRRSFKAFSAEKNEIDARKTVKKLIGHLKSNEK